MTGICMPPPPIPTACAPGATVACPGGSNVGACSVGTQTCDATGNWGACVGQIGPTPEVCDGIDNNCDGQIDEGGVCGGGGGGLPAACTTNADCTVPGETCDPLSQVCGVFTQFCGDGNPCTDNLLDPLTGLCSNPPLPAGTACASGGPGAVCDGAGACTPALTCTDQDGDGFAINGGGCGPVDCNDANPAIYPGAPELCGDLVDNNCDGTVDTNCTPCSSPGDPICAPYGACDTGYPGASNVCVWAP